MSDADLLVDVDDLHVAYGTFEAVRGVTFQVSRGAAFGLVGPNGAGKTSTLKVLAGLLRPCGGVVRVCGYDVVQARQQVARQIGYMADFFGVYDYLTVTEYLSFFGGMYAMEGRAFASSPAGEGTGAQPRGLAFVCAYGGAGGNRHCTFGVS